MERAVGYGNGSAALLLGDVWVDLATGERGSAVPVTKGDLTREELAAQLRQYFTYQGDRHAVDGVREAVNRLAMPDGVFPGMIHLGCSPPGTVFQAGRAVFAILDSGEVRQILGPPTRAGQLGVILEGPEVDATVHEDETQRVERLLAQVLDVGSKAKAEHRWCSTYERIIRNLGLTMTGTGQMVTVGEARLFPPGSLFRYHYAENSSRVSAGGHFGITRLVGGGRFRFVFGRRRTTSSYTTTMEALWDTRSNLWFFAYPEEIECAPVGARLVFGTEITAWERTEGGWRAAGLCQPTTYMLECEQQHGAHWVAIP